MLCHVQRHHQPNKGNDDFVTASKFSRCKISRDVCGNVTRILLCALPSMLCPARFMSVDQFSRVRYAVEGVHLVHCLVCLLIPTICEGCVHPLLRGRLLVLEYATRSAFKVVP